MILSASIRISGLPNRLNSCNAKYARRRTVGKRCCCVTDVIVVRGILPSSFASAASISAILLIEIRFRFLGSRSRFSLSCSFSGFHMFCLDPPLASIPKGQWFCHICLFESDFGFDEGEEHSLTSFQARDLEFRKLWFQSHPPDNDGSHETSSKNGPDPAVNRFGDVVVTETDVENEFWRLVQSSTETVEVEYGADVHSTTHGRCVAQWTILGFVFDSPLQCNANIGDTSSQ